MHIPKKYGQSRIDKCPFCGMQSITINKQGVPVCAKHKSSLLENLKCICGEYLDMKTGKYGVFFNCMNCGNMNLRKVLEANDVKDKENIPYKENKVKEQSKREVTIRSDDPDYF